MPYSIYVCCWNRGRNYVFTNSGRNDDYGSTMYDHIEWQENINDSPKNRTIFRKFAAAHDVKVIFTKKPDPYEPEVDDG